MRMSSLHLKAFVGISIFAGTTIAAIAQEDPLDEKPKPTLADVQHLAEAISSDEFNLRAYCEMGALHDELQQAIEYNVPRSGRENGSAPLPGRAWWCGSLLGRRLEGTRI